MATPSPSPVPRARGGGFLASEPLLLIGLVILTLYFGRLLLIPLAFAVVLTFLLSPAVSFLERYIHRAPAVVLVILVFFSGLGITAWVVTRQLVHVAEALPEYRPNIQSKFDRIHASVGVAASHSFSSLEQMVKEFSRQPTPTPPPAETRQERERAQRHQRTMPNSRLTPPGATAATATTEGNEPAPIPVEVVEPPVSATSYFRSIATPMLKPLGEAGTVIIFTIYMLMNREDLRNRLLLLAGMGRLNLMTRAIQDGAQRISSYLAWQFVLNLCYGCIVGIGLFAIGVPDATLWGALAGIFRYVPYVGPAVGGLLPVVFSIATSPGWTPTLETAGLFVAIEVATANFFEPWLYGRRTGISSLALLASAIFWSILWGGAGLVLATPLTVCLIVMGRYVPQMGFLHVLLGEDAELAPEARVYERLLAADQAEMEALADRFLESLSLREFYDTVLTPALSLAEHDRHKGALEEGRVNFLFLSAAEVISELADHQEKPALATDSEKSEGARAPVVCIPASDQADELTATMLAQLLERAGHDTLLLPNNSLVPEILERLGEDPGTIICVSALPPFAFTPARALCIRLRKALPANRILVGVWLSAQDPEILRQRFGAHGPDRVVVRLAEALEQVEQWERQPRISEPPTHTADAGAPSDEGPVLTAAQNA